jgi:23S rRNA (uridine2552-2'-O)-methyltransferase
MVHHGFVFLYLFFRARSAFKLMEIDDKYKILRPGATVVDCGAAPGSWSQVAAERVNSEPSNPRRPAGFVVAVDLHAIYPIPGVTVLAPADFTLHETREQIVQLLEPGRTVDVVLSDMSPRASGTKKLDQDSSLALCESVLTFARQVFAPGSGLVLCKMLSGGDTSSFMRSLKDSFEFATFVKPNASRSDSSEIFLLARGKR